MSTTVSQPGVHITGIDVIAYLAKDGPRAVAFYRDVLGLPVFQDYGEQGAEFELPDGTTFGIWDPKGAFPWQKGSGVMFAVDEFEAAVAAARARGVAIVHVEETPSCRMAVAHDTEGNEFILHKRKA